MYNRSDAEQIEKVGLLQALAVVATTFRLSAQMKRGDCCTKHA